MSYEEIRRRQKVERKVLRDEYLDKEDNYSSNVNLSKVLKVSRRHLDADHTPKSKVVALEGDNGDVTYKLVWDAKDSGRKHTAISDKLSSNVEYCMERKKEDISANPESNFWEALYPYFHYSNIIKREAAALERGNARALIPEHPHGEVANTK